MVSMEPYADDDNLEKAVRKIESIMREQSVNKLKIQRQDLPEIFDAHLLEIYEDFPILKPFVEKHFRSKGISIRFSSNAVKFKREREGETMSGFKGSMLVSEEGLPIASALPQGVDETRVAAMTAALLSLAERSILEMKKGEFDQLFIKGSDGFLLVLREGSNVVLKIDNDARSLLLYLDRKRTSGI